MLLHRSGFRRGEILPFKIITEANYYWWLKHTKTKLHPRLGMKAERHPNWKGDAAQRNAGHLRCRAWIKLEGNCERCKTVKATDRHHKDGNTFNNARENIQFVCRRCHQTIDGRLDRLRKIGVDYAATLKGKPKPNQHSQRGNDYAKLYQEGFTSVQIARKFEVHPNSVLCCLKARGVKTRVN